jgi:hypothetical protein
VPTWLLVVLLVVAFFVLRGLVFVYLLWRADRLLKLMQRYWKKELDWAQAGGRKQEIIRLFRSAQIKEPGYDHFSPTPSGQVIHRAGSAFDNLFARRGDVQQLVFDAFVEAKGYFKDEIRRSLIPVYWPSVLINVPADLLVYVGVKPESVAVRVARAVMSVVSFLAAALTVWAALN